MTQTSDPEAIREAVRSRYAAAATAAATSQQASCCGSTSGSSCGCGASGADPITTDLYSIDELGELPGAAVSDIVVQGAMPVSIRTSLEAWAGCLAGALEEQEYRSYLAGAGFTAIDVEATRVYKSDQGCCDDSCTPEQAAFDALDQTGAQF